MLATGAKEGDPRLWIRVLQVVSKKRAGATAKDVRAALGIKHISAIQSLRLLRKWGHVRLSGFKVGGGRPAHVFEITNHGKKALKFHERKT